MRSGLGWLTCGQLFVHTYMHTLCSAVLVQMAGPKRWIAFDGRPTEVDTPYSIRGKQLKELYLTLSAVEGQLEREERLDALLSLKTTVSEHDCRLTREITELVDREAELMQRAMKEASLKGETSSPPSPPSPSLTPALVLLHFYVSVYIRTYYRTSLQGCASVSTHSSCSTSRPPSSTQLLPATSKYVCICRHSLTPCMYVHVIEPVIPPGPN